MMKTLTLLILFISIPLISCFGQTEAQFKKGSYDLYKYFEKRAKCENPNIDNVMFEVKIFKSGKVDTEHIKFHGNPGNCKEAIVKAIKKMPKWNPAKDNDGNPIDATVIINLNI